MTPPITSLPPESCSPGNKKEPAEAGGEAAGPQCGDFQFAVVDEDGLAVVAQERLRAAGQIDDLQAHCAERDISGFVGALLIGATMNQAIGGFLDRGRRNGATAMRIACYSAHGEISLGCSLIENMLLSGGITSLYDSGIEGSKARAA